MAADGRAYTRRMSWWKLGTKTAGRRTGGNNLDLTSVTSHLMLDLRAETADSSRPAFMAPPEGAPPFHGFAVLDDVCVEGFCWGGITDFERDPGRESGDAFIVAPDGSRAGLEWRVDDETWLLEMSPPNERRWGVYLAGIERPLVDRSSARRVLADLVPLLRPPWEAWASITPG